MPKGHFSLEPPPDQADYYSRKLPTALHKYPIRHPPSCISWNPFSTFPHLPTAPSRPIAVGDALAESRRQKYGQRAKRSSTRIPEASSTLDPTPNCDFPTGRVHHRHLAPLEPLPRHCRCPRDPHCRRSNRTGLCRSQHWDSRWTGTGRRGHRDLWSGSGRRYIHCDHIPVSGGQVCEVQQGLDPGPFASFDASILGNPA